MLGQSDIMAATLEGPHYEPVGRAACDAETYLAACLSILPAKFFA